MYFALSDHSRYQLEDITAFNNRCFPVRGNHRAYDRYRFVENPFASEKLDFIYGVEKEGQYVAQMLTMPAPLSLDNRSVPAFWGQDYFVLEDFRGEGIGKKLSDYYLAKDYYIAVGFSEKSAIIHQKMGARKIGYLDFYRRWFAPLTKVKFLLHRLLKLKPKAVESYRFPQQVGSFHRANTAAELQLPELNWSAGVVETQRDHRYLQWRFFHRPHRYSVYHTAGVAGKNDTYFVAKPYFYKGVNWLRIVDYRFELSRPEQFDAILKAAQQLCRQLNLFGLLMPSSQATTAAMLEEKSFHRMRHEVVLTTFPFAHAETDEAHNHFCISFADSDIDMHSNLGIFNYC